MASLSNKTVGELTVAELEELLQSLSLGQPKKAKKAKKDPSAPKKEVSAGVAAWNAYVTQVKEELGCSRKEAMTEASKRKAEGNAEYAAAAASRRAKRDEQLAKKASPPPDKPVPASPEKPSAERPKKVLSPEHKAKMQEGAKASREAKKAAKAAPVAAAAEEDWICKTISGKKHIWYPSNNHCYRCEADGSQGEWAGLYNPKTQKIDDSVEEPVEFEEELPLCKDCGEKPVTAINHRYCEGCK